MSDYTSIEQALLTTLDWAHILCVSFALLIFFLSLARRYQEFGTDMGVKYTAGVMAVFLLICFFPSIAGYMFSAMIEWGRERSQELDKAFLALKGFTFMASDGGWLDVGNKIVFGAFNPIYSGITGMGYFIKQAVIIFVCGAFLVYSTLSPIFLASLLVPEMKSMGVNLLCTTFGFVMMPMCLLFGDMIVVWALSYSWGELCANLAFGTATGAGALAAATPLLAVSAPAFAVAIPITVLGGISAFLGLLIVLCFIIYIGIPCAVMSLFKGGAIGNAMAIGMGVGSNLSSMGKSGQGVAKGAGGLGGISGSLQSMKTAAGELSKAAKGLMRRK